MIDNFYEIKKILEENNIKLELKNYKEMPAREGFAMNGNLYVNGKKAINFYDVGNGGEIRVEILNQENSQPLLDLKAKIESTIHIFETNNEDKDKDNKSFYSINDIFYHLADELAINKVLQRESLKQHLIKTDVNSDTYNMYKISFPLKKCIEHFKKDKQSKEALFWDRKIKQWV